MSRYIIFSLAGWKKSNHIFEEGASRILKTIRFDIAAVGFKMKCKKEKDKSNNSKNTNIEFCWYTMIFPML